MTLDQVKQPEITQEAIAAAEEILARFEETQTGDLIVGGITLTGAEIPAALERYQAKLTALRELQGLGFLWGHEVPVLEEALIAKLQGRGEGGYTTQDDLQELVGISSTYDSLLDQARGDLPFERAKLAKEH